jgi:hypothetical protein
MKKYFLILPLVILGFTSCEDVIEVDLKEENTDLFAVEAKITTADEPFVFLTKALPVTVDQSYEGISDALVTITDDAQPSRTLNLVEDPGRKGYYIIPPGMDYYGEVGREYTVTIESKGVTLIAKDRLTPVTPIDSIQIKASLMGDLMFLGIFAYAQEPSGPGDHYKWDVYVNDTLLSDAQNLSIADDAMVDGNYCADLEIFTDFHDPNKPEERKLKYRDIVYIKQTSLSAFSYNFYMQMINQSMTGFLFSVPPANVKGNFTASDDKTVLGMFSAHDVSLSNAVIIDDAIEGQLNKDSHK